MLENHGVTIIEPGKIPIGMVHPDYKFDRCVKATKYQAIFIALQDKSVRYAITFPGLSNFLFERSLIEKYPGIKILCFEKHRTEFKKIQDSFYIPDEVTLLHGNVEDYLNTTKEHFDLIFLDYCAYPRTDLNPILERVLSDSGVFALTYYYGRGTLYKFNPFTGLNTIVKSLDYNHLRFTVYKRAPVNEPLCIKMAYTPGRDPNKLFNTSKLIFKERTTLIQPKSLSHPLLPQTEIQILHMIRKGFTQEKIAEKLGLTQGGVSYRIKKAARRIEFINSRPKLTTEMEIEIQKRFGTFQADLFNTIYNTTCQTRTAEILNEKYDLRGPHRMNQVKVRHAWGKMKKEMSGSKVQEVMDHLDKNLYALHEVRFPN